MYLMKILVWLFVLVIVRGQSRYEVSFPSTFTISLTFKYQTYVRQRTRHREREVWAGCHQLVVHYLSIVVVAETFCNFERLHLIARSRMLQHRSMDNHRVVERKMINPWADDFTVAVDLSNLQPGEVGILCVGELFHIAQLDVKIRWCLWK